MLETLELETFHFIVKLLFFTQSHKLLFRNYKLPFILELTSAVAFQNLQITWSNLLDLMLEIRFSHRNFEIKLLLQVQNYFYKLTEVSILGKPQFDFLKWRHTCECIFWYSWIRSDQIHFCRTFLNNHNWKRYDPSYV